VTEFPELQHALVAGGRRRYGRAPRAWRLTRAALVAAAVCAAVVAIVVLTRAPDDERTAAPPAADLLTHDYGVFRRPATDADEPPTSVTGMPGLGVEQARLVARNGQWRVYLVAGTLDGRRTLCAFAVVADRSRFGCDAPGSVHGYGFRAADGDPGAVVAVVPDGVEKLAIEFDGETFTTPVQDNAASVRPSPWPQGDGTIAWTDAGGTRHQEPLKSGPPPSGG
jgi:hypothetical protein